MFSLVNFFWFSFIGLLQVYQKSYSGKSFQENSLFSVAGWDIDKYNDLIIQGANTSSSDVFACVADLEGKIIGIFFGYVSEYFFSKKILAQDLIVLFLPDYRSYAYEGLKVMLDRFESWAKYKNFTGNT